MNKFAEISASNNTDELMPHSIEAEQQLLGGLLNNNDLYYSLEDKVDPEHFYDPVHSRIFEIISTRIKDGKLASAVTVNTFLTEDEGLKELGGSSYLAQLMAGSVASSAIKDYSKLVYDLAIRRELIILGQEISSRAQSIKVDEQPEEQIILAEQNLYKIGDSGKSETGFKSFLKALGEAVQVANAAHHRDGNLAGISTGFIDLDKKMGGLHSSDLIILAGRPSMGKTSLATNIAYNIAKSFKKNDNADGTSETVNGGIVGFYSLEMSAEQLAARILSETAEIPSEQIRRGDMTESEFRRFVEAAKSIESSPLFIDDTPALTIAQLASRARRLKRTHGLDALIIDYLQLVRAGSSRDNRVNEISEITQGLKAIAKELNIPVIALSQLSRQVENRDDKRPQLADLRESGSIEQDADVVLFVYREEYYKEREKPSDHDLEKMAIWQEEMDRLHGRAELILGKQRHGPIGTVELSFEGKYTRFGNLVKPWQQ
ncbi:MAG: replicative DNA helicase [Paracoccaceae bacterium]|jgi:replicative DNA helicase|nr:replicative DNA helicase [Paracoccaceae bacterium]MEC8760835.1 replicative DNA helicase [Pseudomonadota bacterium]NCX27265.1 replicative DNA helicase [Rhodobacterales bacterium]MBR35967.1 replicative DNA helicase [Paracoccaceae bacterium]MDP6191886.1 replicative DNA helicase [Paracoccaceae bacterium]|tara:strand:- start:1620 stop:3086 length:1467 start_codon:yes stop_codon:yes gene_type:complete